MRAAVPLLLVALLACSRGADDEGKRRLFSREAETGASPGAFDFGHPMAALELDADAVARRLGSFEWSAAVEWTVERQGDDAQRVHAAERHRVRQAVTGEFDVSADLDPGQGPGSQRGKEIVFAGGMTYGRAMYAPFRERPTDRGRDARRFRSESFGLPRSLVRLLGGALEASPAGDVTVLGRPAKRYTLALAGHAAPAAPPPRPPNAPPADEDTRRRLRFLEGRVPLSAQGELVLDAVTGAPLRVRIDADFGVKDEPRVRATVALLAQVRAIGGQVAAIAPPAGALPDERKAEGVARALDAAGFRKRGEETGREEPAEDSEP